MNIIKEKLNPEPLGGNYSSWDIEPLSKEERKDFQVLCKNLIGYGILAPSTHNTQPWLWKVDLDSKSIRLRIDKMRILPESDKKGRQAYISLGCALANFRIAAAGYGLDTSVNYLEEEDQTLVAQINIPNFETPGEDCVNMLAAIKERRVNRSEYDESRPVPSNVMQQIEKSVYGDNLKFFAITDDSTKYAIAMLQEQADQIVFNTDGFRHELADWLIPNNTDSYLAMPGETFGLNDNAAFKINSELHAEGRFDPDLSKMVAVGDREGIKSSPVLGVICAAEDTKKSWVMAGEAFEKIALIAQDNGLNTAVNAALIEVGLSNKALKLRLGTTMRPTVLFRIGYATKERPHSPRLPVSEVLE